MPGQACWTAPAPVCDPHPVFGWLARIVALGALAYALGLAWFVGAPVGPARDDARTDGIVVLTGDNGRIPRGLELLRARAAPRLLISGVAADVGPRSLAREAQVPFDLFRCCVDLGHEAVDTRSNAEETARWVAAHRVRSLRLVTSDYHMRRATMELASELGPGVAILQDAVPTHVPLAVWSREYAKWIVRSIVRRAQAA